ncbi:MAG: lipopolysaccharide heptosyltransferase I [Betaproteobacteria bacterium]|nr:lipopolysaccharide heptosyltransferase I [Betaproteobacteria bacterium]
MPAHSVPPRAILLVKTSSLGDVVHNLPVLSDLRRKFPDAAIDWVVEESFAEIPALHPALRRVIPVALRRWRKALWSAIIWRELAAFRRDLQRQDYDLVLDTQGLVKSGLVVSQARLSAHGQRCGYAAEAAREPLAARFYDAGFAIPKNLHAVERNRCLAAAACGYLPNLPLEYGIATASLTASWLPPDPYAVLLIATSRADKQWPDHHWLELAAALAQRGLSCVLPSGTHAEREHAQRLAQGMSRAVLAPALSITDLAGLCSGARLVVGVDTGLTHLAAALGRPTVALFCGSDPQLTGVYAAESSTSRAVNLGMPGVAPTAADVIAAAVQLID